MKAKKKRLGTKAQIRTMKERERRIASIITAAILITVISISGFVINSMLNQPSTSQTVITPKPKAVIIDQGSLSPAAGPNPVFIETATHILKQAGYTVDYYPGEKVTVEFYRNLPTHGYSLIILRVHSAIEENAQSVGLFTSEKYTTTKYIYEQLTDQLYEGHIGTGFVEGLTYFGITPNFVKASMKGKFQNAIVVLMGCNGLTYTNMAQALIEKGAKAYISWSGTVLASHTDQATTQLLKHLITEKQTIKKAVTETMEEVGPDPVDNSILQYYPLESGNSVIPVSSSNLTINLSKYESG